MNMPLTPEAPNRCRCGAAFKYAGGKRLCPPCLQRNRERSNKERTYAKCGCGATLGLHAQSEGRTRCGRCEDRVLQLRRQDALDRFADRLIEGGQ